MKTKDIEALESYFNTENEHWNGFAFNMLCEVLQFEQFKNPELPLILFENAEENFLTNNKKPVKAIKLFAEDLDKNKLTVSQKLFIYEWVYKYLKGTYFEEIDLTRINNLLYSQIESLKSEILTAHTLTMDIRHTLKGIMQKEVEALPETLKNLDPVQRLNILCKLIPFILPKVESIHHELNEPI